MATGLLVLGVERGTKFLAHLIGDRKTYTATVRLGVATITDDAEGDITATTPVSDDLTDEVITAALAQFSGEIMQRPSAVSAIKINGQRSYARVRSGEDVSLPARPVTIYTLEVSEIRRHAVPLPNQPSPPSPVVDVSITVECSSGTYIRAIARDLGDHLGVGGHLTALRRTSVGAYRVEDALTLEALGDNPHLSLSLDAAILTSYPSLPVNSAEAIALSQGKRLPGFTLTQTHAAIDSDGHVIALVTPTGTGEVKTVFVARPAGLH